ncbi:MAG: glycoside hydrolase family 127 protein [Tannerella sp.]|jgi:hypothetical protein|nr:glycoside hydrolase family 127 protein [Tannerella sp.]
MKNSLLPLFLLIAVFACDSDYALERRDKVMLGRRDFILSDTSIRVKPVFIPLPAGSVQPQGWIKDWATAAADGITGHLDEWSITYGMAWKGVGFEATGVDPKTGTGWPLEQCSYWLDGAVRLAYLLNDSALIRKVSDRLEMVVSGVLNGGKSFVYWQDDLDFKNNTFNNWAHSHMGRALVAWYEATGDARILEALVRVYSHFDVQPVPWYMGDVVSGCTNIDPMLAVYELSGNRDVLDAILRIACDSLTAETVRRWNQNDFNNAHGVITYENLRIPAMMYPVTGQRPMLQAAQNFLAWLDQNYLLPYDIISSEEHVAGIGATRNTETCNVACSAWTYQQMFEVTGDGQWGDRIEKVFFNAGPAPVDRQFQTMIYYQSPNRIEERMPSEWPGHPGEGAYTFKNTGHDVLCCVGNLNRVIPNYVMHMWMSTADKGLAATLYGPCTVKTAVGNGVPVEITSDANYPFEETVRMTVRPARDCTFPLHLRIPAWCRKPEVKLNGELVNTDQTDGFITINRKWSEGDRIELHFPMHVDVRDGRETPYPQEDYFKKGNSAHRILPHKTDINSPYRTVSCGPLLFALAVKDIAPNRQAPGAKWNYALISGSEDDVRIERSEMPSPWSWQIEDAPVRLTLKAGTFNWQPTHLLPLPEEEVNIDETVDITLIPYGCTKFRISMFPIANE